MRFKTFHKATLAALGLLAAAGSVSAAPLVGRSIASGHTNSVQTNHGTNGAIISGGCTGQLMLDPGLEATDGSFNNPNWTSTSTNFGNAFCTVAACGGVAHGGTFFAWLGGSDNAEVSTLSQAVVLSTPGPRYLNFFMLQGLGDSPFNDVTLVKVDGTTVRTFNEPAAQDPGYVQRSVDISSFVNGASHTISFEFTHTVDGSAGGSTVLVDDITIDCAQLPVTLQSYKVD